MISKRTIYILFFFIFTPFLFSSSKEILKLTFPYSRVIKNYRFNKIRFAGKTLKNAKLTVNGEPVKVYPTGAFVGTVNLSTGINYIEFKSTTLLGTTTQIFTVIRKLPPISVSTDTLKIEDDFILPDKNLILFPGDNFTIRFRGTPGCIAYAEIPALQKIIYLIELPNSIAPNNLSGVYETSYRVLPTDIESVPKEIKFFLKSSTGAIVEKVIPWKIGIMKEKKVAKVISDTQLFVDADINSYPYPIKKETKLLITGKTNEFYRVETAPEKYFWIQEHAIEFYPEEDFRLSELAEITISTENFNKLDVTFHLTQPNVYTITESTTQEKLTITFYNTVPSIPTTFYLIDHFYLKEIVFSSFKTITWCELNFNTDQQWGYDSYYLDVSSEKCKLVLSLNLPPRIKEVQPLKGIKIFLDPGHGGNDLGAVSPTGIFEKNVNLDIALSLGKILKKSGAEIVFSRTTDTYLSLEERFKKAKETQCQIYLWIHNNSIPDNWVPTKHYGSIIFYTYPSGKKLAQILLNWHRKIKIYPKYISWRKPHSLQPTNMIFILTESLFMSHPEDEMLLLRKNFKKKIAESIAQGVKEFLRDNAFKE